MTLSKARAMLLLSALTVGFYGNALEDDFIWDDRSLILDNPYIQDGRLLMEGLLSDFWRVIEDPSRFRNYYRPLTTLTYFIDHAFWGDNPAGYHATNVLFHVASVLLVFLLALELTLPMEAALVAAALFATHPIHSESVTWISGRTDVLAGAFALGAFWLALRARASRRPILVGASSVGLYVLAILAKEVAIVLPASVPFAFVFSDSAEGRQRLRILLAAMASAAVTYVILRTSVLGMPLVLPGPKSPLVLLFNLPVLLGWYVLKLVLPFPLSAHVPLEWVPFERWPLVVAASASLAGTCLLVALLGRRNRVAVLGGAWIVLFLLPVLNAGSFTDVLVAERFLYLPSVGACWLAGVASAVALAHKKARAWLRPTAAILVLAGGLGIWKRNAVWRDDLVFFQEMVTQSSRFPLPHALLGQAYLRRGDPESAIRHIREALRLGPTNCLILNSLALAYLRLGVQTRSGPTLDSGFALVEQAVLGPCGPADVLYNTLGEYYMRQKNVEIALVQFRKALSLNPLRMGYYHNVGTILFATGRKTEARPYLEQFVARAPRGPLRDQALTFLSQ